MRIIRSASSWAKTCNLLSTKMPTRISSQHQKWVENESQINEVFKRLNFNREIDLIVHDGPPYANGAPHIGHAANKILKDFIVRRAVLNGKCVNFRPGWDCHGMPIEHKVLSTNKLSDPIQLRQMCQRESLAHAKRQSSEFQKWGLFADWDNPYYTLDPKIQLYEVGVVTCDVKPVFWSPSSKSTLAEAELEYNDNHVSTAAFVSFPITNGIECPRPNAFLMVWTTQPWTLAANKAVAYAPTASYTWLVSDHDPTAAFLVAIECVSLIQKHISGLKQLSHCIAGETLGNISYTLPLFGNTGASHLFPSAHVKLDSGSGLVHLAPCHGEDDFHIARRHNLSTQSILDDEGRMTNIPGNPVAGSQGDKAVLDLFTHNVLISYPYKHSYPYDWRTRKPIIRLVSRQWFVKPLVEECRTILRSTDFYPSNGESDLNSMLAGRPYWCISRQRAWGVPIPVFYKTLNSDEDILINKDVVYHVAAMVEEKGTSDFWWTESSENLLPKSISDAEDWKPGRDIFDVWFDSGSTWHTVLKQLPNCEYKPVIYLEGRDQLRGWFQSSLLLCSAAERRSPFSTLIMHGFVVDGNGRKMSKSEGNVISPDQVLKEWGVGVLRAWVASIDYHDNMVLSNLSNIAQICKRLRFVLRFMLGNLDKSILESRDSLLPSCFKVSYDKYILHQLFHLNQKCNVAYDKYRFSFVFKLISDFVTKDLSAFYFDGVKDRLYCSSKLDPQRLSAVYTMECALQTLSFHLAPLLPHLVEEVHIYHPMRNSISYFDRKPFICPDWWPNEKLSSIIDKAINIRNAIHSQLNTTPHEIKKHCVHLTTNSDSLLAELLFLQECGTLLELMGTCEISCQKAIDVENYVVINNAKVGLEIKKSDKFLCGRCRNLWADVEGDLCSRCSHMWKYFGGKIAGSLCGLQKLICKRQFSEVCNLDAMRTSFGRTTLCGQTSRFIGQNVTLMGWLTANRSINKHHRFLLLHDWSGDVQVTFSSELQNMQLLESVLELPLNSVLSISGKVQQRANAHQNPSMKTGDIEVIAESIDVLNKYTSSVIFETSGTKRTANEEFRLKYRYLDFRREVMQRNLRMRSNFCAKVRSFLISQMDFVEIETPSLVRETPGGANEFLVTSKFKGEFFTLPQSPQLFKQLLMVGGFDRYFQVAKCYRDEDLKSDRQPEFTQLDLEMAFATADDVICVIENCLKELLVPYMPQLVLPFDRISYAKAIRLYGSDKPDRRIPGTLHNITDMFFKSKSFSSSEIVKVVKDSSLSNTSLSKQYRLTNFQNISHARVHHDNTFKFASHQLASQFNEHAQDYLRNELQLQDCDLIVFAWGSNELQVCQALGLLRTSLSKQSNLNMDMDIFWVEDFPLFEIDESSCLSSAHHPFTAPHIEDEHLLFQEGADLTKVRGQHYDLVMNGNEIGGGSVRIHSAHTQSRIFDILDLDPSTMSALLEGLSSGAPPHAGIALGLDRILAILCNANSIRDVIAFPKASSGRDLLFQAPTIPSKDALQRYFLNNFNFGDIDK